MSKVYFVHRPSQWDRVLRSMVPLDLTPAEKFGDIIVMIDGTDRPPSADEALPLMRKKLAGFTAADYLAVAGDFDLVVWASIIASRRVGDDLRLLKYNNRARDYDIKQAPRGLTD